MQERPHVKPRLIVTVAKFAAHGARAPRKATMLSAFPPCIAEHVLDARTELECARAEGIDRARREARLRLATCARMHARCGRRQLHQERQQKRSAVGMPQTPPWVDQQTDRALMHRLAAQRQALKGQWSRGGSARIDVDRVEFARERSDRAPRPAVERMRQSILRLGSASKVIPLQTTGESEQHHGQGRREPAIELAGFRVERAAHREAGLGCTVT